MGDLKSKRLIVLKGFFFLLIILLKNRSEKNEKNKNE